MLSSVRPKLLQRSQKYVIVTPKNSAVEKDFDMFVSGKKLKFLVDTKIMQIFRVLAVRNDLTDTESRREVSLHDNFVRIQKLNLYSYFKSLVCTLIVIQTALSFFQKHIQPIYIQ